eukprot:TRINITY_DN13826_c0_g1_i1.p1 TRINITY_DN13826_c0_g1~~TRINITY_DN13826_c0_g1_i1.p1  ORF type:complete len:246 (+),score=34.40 TRINITY_DN13826_c0_g1_i1:64-738(+)
MTHDTPFPEGAEVEAHSLVNTVELNGLRGFVTGYQRAPDGVLLAVVRFETGDTRLIPPEHLAAAKVAPMHDLSGMWSCWYGSKHVFQHQGDRLAIIDVSTGEMHEGTVTRETQKLRAIPKMKVRRATHPTPWVGVLDEPPPPHSTLPTPVRPKHRFPWNPKPARPLLTIHAMGSVGTFDGDIIKWKSGSVWQRKGGPPPPSSGRVVEGADAAPLMETHGEDFSL